MALAASVQPVPAGVTVSKLHMSSGPRAGEA